MKPSRFQSAGCGGVHNKSYTVKRCGMEQYELNKNIKNCNKYMDL